MQNNRRGIKETKQLNNKTIENAKMVSFRIITEFLLSTFCCFCKRVFYMQIELIKKQMFICPLPRRFPFDDIEKETFCAF